MKLSRSRLLAPVLAAGLLLTACTSGGDSTPTSPPASDGGPTATTVPAVTTAAGSVPVTSPPSDGASAWTVLIYVMGDTDLEPFAVEDLLEMASVGSTDEVNIVALVDRHPAFSDEGVLNMGDWEDTRLIAVDRGELVEVAGPLGGELNMGSPDTLARFIEVGAAAFPAERYAVILWDHGAGWPGMGPDETDGLDVLDLADIRAGFEAGLATAGLERVDLVGFDACLMATYEVASVMADYADYMLASQELEPGHGWDYGSLAVLTGDPGASAVQLGSSLIEGFNEQAASSGTDEAITLSLLDLRAIDGVQAGLADLAVPLASAPEALAPALGRARSTSLSFGRNPDPSLDSNLVDIGQLMEALAASAEFADPAAATVAALDDLVVASTTGRATAGASGLSLYFPEFERDFRQGYLFLEGVPVWPDLVSGYYQTGADLPAAEQPDFTEIDGEPAVEYFFDFDGINILGLLDIATQDNVTEATTFYGVLDESDDSIIFIGEEPAEVAEDGSGLIAAIYDLTVLSVTDGIDTSFAYLALTFDPDTGVAFIDVPLAYVAPEDFDSDEPLQDVLLFMVVDPETEEILSQTYYVVDESGTFGEIRLDPAGLVFPIVLNLFPDGSQEWILATDIGLFADLDLLEFELIPLESGTGIYVEVVVFDYAGNSDSVSVFDFIP